MRKLIRDGEYLKHLITLLSIAMIILTGCSQKEKNIGLAAVEMQTTEDEQNINCEYRKITPEEAKEMIEGGNAVILDVRTEQEFEEAHIENAILLPDYDIEAMASEMLTDKDATILVYCRSGRRSEAAAKTLTGMGYTGIYDFGGILDWPYETVIRTTDYAYPLPN